VTGIALAMCHLVWNAVIAPFRRWFAAAALAAVPQGRGVLPLSVFGGFYFISLAIRT
jgi:hypothetical protein